MIIMTLLIIKAVKDTFKIGFGIYKTIIFTPLKLIGVLKRY